MDESRLIEKLLRIEALFAGATTEGERVAAGRARERIRDRLEDMRAEEPPVEFQFSMRDMWSRKVFVALCRRYGLKPYRYTRQRYTTVMVRSPRRFLDETLWPEFKNINEELNFFLNEVTDRVIRQVLDQESGEAEVVKELSATGAAMEDPETSLG
jgi:hypothetical protein